MLIHNTKLTREGVVPEEGGRPRSDDLSGGQPLVVAWVAALGGARDGLGGRNKHLLAGKHLGGNRMKVLQVFTDSKSDVVFLHR